MANPKRLTIFYSWQSDSPSEVNRTFIETALVAALKRLEADTALEPALRDTHVQIDRDTQGVAGSQPIAQTILNKIDDCAIFVADLTFVGQSMRAIRGKNRPRRLLPNPNVLLEYGYAFRSRGHERMISVMNTAYGSPVKENLPFDLRHIRWPITYCLPDSQSGQDATVLVW